MPTYIVLGQFTDQGVRTVKETTKRADAFKAMAKKAGATVKEIYWTLGHYDLVTVVEAADDVAATALLLSAGSLGNIRTQTLRAFSADEMGRVLGKMT
ncbi:MAG TPA: GYD domain-containing protein [Vicinamibacteria bacterium]|nr:GYD domain-containing protein [Vicinamibacteria bacterium]